MKKSDGVLVKLKEELSGLLGTMLVSERLNSQRCIAKDIDTTKTIVDHKDELTQEEIKKISEEIKKISDDIKGMANTMLFSERMNSQRCIAKDLDTTKTIADHKNEENEFTKEDLSNLVHEAKKVADTLLLSERTNSQRCIAKDLDTTKTIIDHSEDKNEVNKHDIENILHEIKGIIAEMLVSERTNSQRCIAKDLDTTKTIIDHK